MREAGTLDMCRNPLITSRRSAPRSTTAAKAVPVLVPTSNRNGDSSPGSRHFLAMSCGSSLVISSPVSGNSRGVHGCERRNSHVG